MLGNFRHLPNWDSVQYTYSKIWPQIRKKLPEAQLHIYGAYVDKQSSELNNPGIGFLIKGAVHNQYKFLEKYRVTLSPLRFGAGIKGKITDSWMSGTPVITTPIGKEGMSFDNKFGGLVGSSDNDIINNAINLYTKEDMWNEYQAHGDHILINYFNAEKNGTALMDRISNQIQKKKTQTNIDLLEALLWSERNRSTEYLSRFISFKKKMRLKKI